MPTSSLTKRGYGGFRADGFKASRACALRQQQDQQILLITKGGRFSSQQSAQDEGDTAAVGGSRSRRILRCLLSLIFYFSVQRGVVHGQRRKRSTLGVLLVLVAAAAHSCSKPVRAALFQPIDLFDSPEEGGAAYWDDEVLEEEPDFFFVDLEDSEEKIELDSEDDAGAITLMEIELNGSEDVRKVLETKDYSGSIYEPDKELEGIFKRLIPEGDVLQFICSWQSELQDILLVRRRFLGVMEKGAIFEVATKDGTVLIIKLALIDKYRVRAREEKEQKRLRYGEQNEVQEPEEEYEEADDVWLEHGSKDMLKLRSDEEWERKDRLKQHVRHTGTNMGLEEKAELERERHFENFILNKELKRLPFLLRKETAEILLTRGFITPLGIGRIMSLPSRMYLNERYDVSNMAVLGPLMVCTLRNLIDDKVLTYSAKMYFTVRMMSLLTWLHDRGVLHLDIRPENIYVNAEGHGFLGGLYSATAVDTLIRIRMFPGYTAPEVYFENYTPTRQRRKNATASSSNPGDSSESVHDNVIKSNERRSILRGNIRDSVGPTRGSRAETGNHNSFDRRQRHKALRSNWMVATFELDAWAAGHTLYEIWCGRPPLRVDYDNFEEVYKEQQGRPWRYRGCKGTPDGIKSLIDGLLAWQERRRLLPFEVFEENLLEFEY